LVIPRAPFAPDADGYSWDVFLSHNSSDKPRVERLAKALVARGLRVWFDKTAILGSSSIPLAVEEGLEGSRTVVLCLSPAFLASEWTAYERASILHQDPSNKRRSFLLLEFRTCALPRGLAHFRRLDFKRYRDTKVDEIVDALGLTVPSAKPPPGPVANLLDEAKAADRRGDYGEELKLAEQALGLAVTVDPPTAESIRDVARARAVCSRALLQMGHDRERAWELADLACDPKALDGYPDLLFDALIAKAEAAAMTDRIQVMGAAVAAAQAISDGEENELVVLQLRARLALMRAPLEAAQLYEEAAERFGVVLHRSPDPDSATMAHRGIGVSLHNKGMALRSGGDIVGASIAFARAADWYGKAASPIDESVSRFFLARCHFDEQLWGRGFEELDRAQSLATGAKFDRGLVECLELRGRALATTDRRDEAREALLAAVAMSEPGTDADGTRRFRQMLATLEEEAGNLDAAREHLAIARVLAEQGGDSLDIADVAHQLGRLGKGRRDAEPAPPAVIEALHRELRETERPASAAQTMQQLGGAYRSHDQFDNARDWYKRAHDTAMGVGDQTLAASALIGLAEVALTRDEDHLAEEHLRNAWALVEYLPAWDVRASIGYFQGRLQVRAGDHRGARSRLREAQELAAKHHIDHLAAEIARDRRLVGASKAPATRLARVEQRVGSARGVVPRGETPASGALVLLAGRRTNAEHSEHLRVEGAAGRQQRWAG